ncbi:MAG: hypothetical protein IPG82_13635 [Saprospiraceae bacterium]|nr:hypothetical protein [Saprospiraceae bacterium]MBK6816447.1 hypothetical protein [Saprospiraceae bacterium]MBK6816455.1 hypothetical protein [Saprospiraceae bacterium]MBK7438700.1 hypothetical protein [Saprospiraceae bacterium]
MEIVIPDNNYIFKFISSDFLKAPPPMNPDIKPNFQNNMMQSPGAHAIPIPSHKHFIHSNA